MRQCNEPFGTIPAEYREYLAESQHAGTKPVEFGQFAMWRDMLLFETLTELQMRGRKES